MAGAHKSRSPKKPVVQQQPPEGMPLDPLPPVQLAPAPQAPAQVSPAPELHTHKAAIARILETFRPENNGLPSDFLLLNHTGLKGCGCKVPRENLQHLLGAFDAQPPADDREIGIGLDSCVVPLKGHPGLNLVQTTDFFYPLVDDPYIMGRITAANVLSDLYAMGVGDCDNMLMLLGVCQDWSPEVANVVTPQFIKGFRDAAKQARTRVRGGQTVKCPWLLIGGVATSVVKDDHMLQVKEAKPGDVLVLTKPLGCQVAVNAYEWLKKKDVRVLEHHLDSDKTIRAAQQAMEQMCRLNRTAADLAYKYKAHACTDVTGFGILGHADNLAKVQKASVQFVIDKLPIIEYMDDVARRLNQGNGFNLFSGTSAETSGGLLVVLPADVAEDFRSEIQSADGFPAFIVGRVIASDEDGVKKAIINPKYETECVPSKIHSEDFTIDY